MEHEAEFTTHSPATLRSASSLPRFDKELICYIENIIMVLKSRNMTCVGLTARVGNS
jgi:hypothetical protein